MHAINRLLQGTLHLDICSPLIHNDSCDNCTTNGSVIMIVNSNLSAIISCRWLRWTS